MVKTITIPENICTKVQKAHIERDARRDILLYIMQNKVEIPEERIERYQKEYDEKYFAFEEAKALVEKNFVVPVLGKRWDSFDWNLDYATCIVTINIYYNGKK